MNSISSSAPALILQKERSGADGLSDSSSVSTVVVHPLVLLSVLDHHTRRQEGQPRVIGTLLGRRDGDKVEVTNCFAVPHAELDGEVAIGKDFNRQMLALHLRANRNETVVGWYATSFPEAKECIADTSTLIHEFYADECANTVMDAPVHLVVDTSLTTDTIGVRAYMSSAITLMGEPLANMFHEVRLVLKSSESEKIVLNEMIKSLGDTKIEEEPVSTEQESELQASMEKLLEMLETASEYATKVVDGKMVPDDAVGRQIFDTLSNIPRIRPELFEKMFSDSLQDLLMVSYLSNITKTQLTISEKLNAVMDQNLK